ncbi:hypothetical protein [Clostridium frigidicarnis]|uniref:Uncharacterized protein n=1 Tax=Clostridium frigidicarnis TaxID=84698 RepID=A0A1I0YE29_9CLOT|nr:hypothetical protein [Clostridium frigidicarnis]SFB11047.1 hypothetical protein SAMN04488528_101288 [Clostridium frigidicarnis]
MSKNTNIFIFLDNGNGFLGIIVLIILAIAAIKTGTRWIFDHTIRPWIFVIIKGYFKLFLCPLLFFVKPQDFASGFGTKSVSESDIQLFFQNPNNYITENNGIYSYANIIFALIMLFGICLFYYKNGIIKGKAKWCVRYLITTVLISVPLFAFMLEKVSYLQMHVNIDGHYTEIYKDIQSNLFSIYIKFFIFCILMSYFYKQILLFIGKNFTDREKKRLDKINLRKRKTKEYY